MKPNKIIGILVFVGIGLFLLYIVLPSILTLTTNIFSIGISILLIIGIIAIFRNVKKLFK